MAERARDKAIEKENAKKLGLDDDIVSNPSSPGLKGDRSGLDKDRTESKPTSAQRRREAKMNATKPKERSVEEAKALEELAEEETRIYKLYKDYAINDLKRDKKTAIDGIKRIK